MWKLEFGACSSRLACGCDAITMVIAGRAGSGEPSLFLLTQSSWHVGSGQRRGLCRERVTFYLGVDRPLGLRSGEIREGRRVGRCPCRRGAGMQPPSAAPPGTQPPHSSKHPLPWNWEPALSGQMQRNPSQRYRCWSSFIHESEELSKDFQKLKEKRELEREQETWFSFKWQ